MFPEKTDAKELWFRLGGTRGELELAKRPDFKGMHTNPTAARWVDGYLGLAFAEKDPQISTGLEKDLMRVIALEIKLE